MTTTWRDIQLTADQISRLEQSERSRLAASPLSPCRVNAAEGLLHLAQAYAKENALQTTLAHLPSPEGAAEVEPWEVCDEPVRSFTGSSWRVPVGDILTADSFITVEIVGEQRADGRVTRWLHVEGPVSDLPLPALRMLVESLAEAHAEAERMNQADGGTVADEPVFSHAGLS